METPLFEVVFQMNRQQATELTRFNYRKNWSYACWIFVCIGLSFLSGAASVYVGHDLIGAAAIGCGILLMVMYFGGKKQSAKQLLATWKTIYPDGTCCYVFTENGFGEAEGKRFSYQQITQLFEQPRFFYVFVGTSCLFCPKDSFRTENPAQFAAFIQDKMR